MYTFPPNTHRLAAWPSPSTSGASNFAWCNPWDCDVLEWYRPSWAGASHSRMASETKLPICFSMFGIRNGIPTDLHGIQVSNVKQMKFLLCTDLFIGILIVGGVTIPVSRLVFHPPYIQQINCAEFWSLLKWSYNGGNLPPQVEEAVEVMLHHHPSKDSQHCLLYILPDRGF